MIRNAQNRPQSRSGSPTTAAVFLLWDSLVDRVRKMTPEQRVARMEEIMRIAREPYGHLIEHEEQKDAENHPDHSAA